MNPLKIIITSKTNLANKYGTNFGKIKALLDKLIASDKKRNLNTQLVYIDDSASAKKAGLSKSVVITEKNCKTAIDTIYKKLQPAYIVIFGAQDIIPFQTLKNQLFEKPQEDDPDEFVPSDLPYACDKPYSTMISSFIAPTRVVGRIPDLPVKGDVGYVRTLISNITRSKPAAAKTYQDYFSITAQVWRGSTSQSLTNIFGNSKKLLSSPSAKAGGYTKNQLKPLTHFINCHGALQTVSYYGQKGKSYPDALSSPDLSKTITYGTLVAAECCYGGQLLDPGESGVSIANNYLGNNALAFVGSSTVAYGPADGQGLADLICQYFVINVHKGASSGRAFLEARQKFLNASGPTLDPCELKTFAQFYLLGDPSISLVETPDTKEAFNTTANRRLNLIAKGMAFQDMIAPPVKAGTFTKTKHKKHIADILGQTDFKNNEKEMVFESTLQTAGKTNSTQKAMPVQGVRFRTFQKKSAVFHNGVPKYDILVVKENDEGVLGWRVYSSK